ncbi:MAG: tRNA lysidine(34) synthetase TilS [Saprospiraceae bacterium]|nr:tRNA lysidine(34) synthetase TilS [Saprospiraceae bacterium]
MDLLQKFKEFIKANHLLQERTPALIAVSGGVDSVVLAHLFKDAGLPFAVAHCNFKLRSAASDEDEIFVRDLAARYGAQFHVKHFETTVYAEENGISIQMAARDLRYAWFLEICRTNDYTCLATAHHLNDSVETALLNFIRGTGLPGLTGIAPSIARFMDNPVCLARPLLFATRPDIEAYARQQGLSWREDSSNASDDYTRNFLRHRIVPLMEELNPAFIHTAGRNLHRLSEDESNLGFLTGCYIDLHSGEIDKQKLRALPAPRQVVYKALKHRNFTEEQARQVTENLDETGFEIYSSSGWRLLVDRERLFLRPPADEKEAPGVIQIFEDDLMVKLPDGFRLLITPVVPGSLYPDGKESVVIDADKLQFPLLLRPWKAGDVFQPFGMNGRHQKLQDFFTNLKLTRLDKERVRILENGDGSVIWVPGYRSDERFKAGPGSENLLKISYL